MGMRSFIAQLNCRFSLLSGLIPTSQDSAQHQLLQVMTRVSTTMHTADCTLLFESVLKLSFKIWFYEYERSDLWCNLTSHLYRLTGLICSLILAEALHQHGFFRNGRCFPHRQVSTVTRTALGNYLNQEEPWAECDYMHCSIILWSSLEGDNQKFPIDYYVNISLGPPLLLRSRNSNYMTESGILYKCYKSFGLARNKHTKLQTWFPL